MILIHNIHQECKEADYSSFSRLPFSIKKYCEDLVIICLYYHRTEANNDVPVNDKFEVLRDFALERAKQNEESAKVLNRTLIICGSKQAVSTGN